MKTGTLVALGVVGSVAAGVSAWLTVRTLADRAGFGGLLESDAAILREWRAAGFSWRMSETPTAPPPKRDAWPRLRAFADGRRGPDALARARAIAEADGWSAPVARMTDAASDDLGRAVLLLGDAAVASARAGRVADAEAEFGRLRRIADGVERDPSLLATAIAMGTETRTLRAAARAMRGRPPAARRRLREAVRRPEPKPPGRERWLYDGLVTIEILRRTGKIGADGWPEKTAHRLVVKNAMRAYLRAGDGSRGFRDWPALLVAAKRTEGPRILGPEPGPIERGRLRRRTYEAMLDDIANGTRTGKDAWGRPLRWKGDLPYSLGPDGRDDGGSRKKDVVLVSPSR